MPGKMARSDARPSVRVTRGAGRAHHGRPKKAEMPSVTLGILGILPAALQVEEQFVTVERAVAA